MFSRKKGAVAPSGARVVLPDLARPSCLGWCTRLDMGVGEVEAEEEGLPSPARPFSPSPKAWWGVLVAPLNCPPCHSHHFCSLRCPQQSLPRTRHCVRSCHNLGLNPKRHHEPSILIIAILWLRKWASREVE